ncbi:MAG: cytochrome c biogenesis protein CcdA [Oscillospiraceae bacterium]|nr:cytochrome c biogenesis protein CcdA [Oscillospiraceae bacterium]
MQYIISFLEGIITFISPCLLPMLPIYISYFAGGGQRNTKKTVVNAAGFVLGFTVVFILMGALAGTAGRFLKEYSTIVNIILGSIVIIFGFNYIGLLKFSIFNGRRISADVNNMSFISAFIFGAVFSIGWTPCVGVFLGSALALASQQAHILEGMLMLLAYSMGLGIPFIISAVLIDGLKETFCWIKRNYDIINKICGVFLVIVGILMATGDIGRLLAFLS